MAMPNFTWRPFLRSALLLHALEPPGRVDLADEPILQPDLASLGVGAELARLLERVVVGLGLNPVREANVPRAVDAVESIICQASGPPPFRRLYHLSTGRAPT